MPVMSDRWIRRMAQEHGMIEPFVEAQKREGVISYGLSSYGYDARVGRRVQDLHQHRLRRWSIRRTSPPTASSTATTDVCIIPPNSFALAARSSISASRATCW